MFFKRLRLRGAVTSKDRNMKKLELREAESRLLRLTVCIYFAREMQFYQGKVRKSGKLHGPVSRKSHGNLSGLESYVCFVYIQHQSFNSFEKDAMNCSLFLT